MRKLIRRSVSLAGASLLMATTLGAYEGEIEVTYHYDSDPGDFVGQGGSATWTEADGRWFVSRNFGNGVGLSFVEDPGSSSWSLNFVAADDVELSPGIYFDAQRFPFQDPGHPGLAVFGEGRGCNTLTGEFIVSEVRFDWFGEPVRLGASFEQHCEGANPALTGTVDYAQGVLGPAAPTEGNVLVISDNRLWEFTLGGVLVREIPIMESTGTEPDTSEHARDVVRDGSGRIHIFNGTFDPVLSSFSPGTGNWQHSTFADWAIVNNGSLGRVAAFGDYVFATDGLTGDDGILRFDASAGYSAERFPGPMGFGLNDYNSLAIGLDGRLYALANDERTVDVYFPATMESLGQVVLAEAVRGLAVDAQGEIFGASWDNNIYRFDSTGAVVKSLNPEGIGALHDIDLSRSGQIVVSGGFDEVFVVTDTSLGSATVFPVPDTNESVFVALVQRPPSSSFEDGFETGSTDRWSQTVGAAAGLLGVEAGAANSGAFGLRVSVGGSCSSPQDLIVEPPPFTITGVFEGCSSVSASGVEVVDPGATLQAGSSITLGEGFSVGPGVDFTALLDPALIDGFAFVEDGSPSAQKSHGARFDLRLDDAALADTDTFDVYVGYAAGGAVQFRVIIKRNATLGEDRMVLAAREDGGGFVETPFGEEILLPAGWNRIEVDWQTGAGTGYLLVSLNGAPFVGLTGLDNDLGQVDLVRLGVVAGGVASSSGQISLDDFFSWD